MHAVQPYHPNLPNFQIWRQSQGSSWVNAELGAEPLHLSKKMEWPLKMPVAGVLKVGDQGMLTGFNQMPVAGVLKVGCQGELKGG